MEDTAKYLIHATFTADGVVERSDVVGAIFGQTEGLLGEELDLRELQQSSKVGRIDVEADVTRGQTEGTITIASGLDRVATATLAASLETLTRIGPCQARCEVADIEDVRAAKRRRVVERAKELLNSAFDDSVMSSDEILREVREHVRVEDVTEYDGLPAGPRVADSDAIIVVEGRSDVLQLLKYGIKNAVAVEGTNVPDVIAELTAERTVTAFLDGDRGGDLILRELADVGDVDYVALAPADKSVEDLSHHDVFDALREKVPYETVAGANDPREAVAATDGSATPAPADGDGSGSPTDASGAETAATPDDGTRNPDGPSTTPDATDGASSAMTDDAEAASDAAPASDVEAASDGESASVEEPSAPEASQSAPTSLREHVAAVVDEGTGEVRLLDDEYETLGSASAADAFELLRDAAVDPHAVVLDGELTQKVLDVASQRGVDHVVADSFGDFVKRPTSVRIRTAADLTV
ncbi:DNA primase [Halorubellus sp. JP-L1]|uniref:DNA primase DnaG n=1 Tax=Halorubellus sp. JP-L1 TaxID=2715753 RepID=UPI00140E57CE|nr:DNA primase DnaG [Halorubellus sp. JP-L1]NHN41114.1 DNA primase [Halorubellus sp. JP-L1]